MNRVASLSLMALPLALLAACHGSDRQPGATTPGEDKQLDEAAAMQDANSMEVNAVDMNRADQGDDSDGNDE
jgi:hypothetical protein